MKAQHALFTLFIFLCGCSPPQVFLSLPDYTDHLYEYGTEHYTLSYSKGAFFLTDSSNFPQGTYNYETGESLQSGVEISNIYDRNAVSRDDKLICEANQKTYFIKGIVATANILSGSSYPNKAYVIVEIMATDQPKAGYFIKDNQTNNRFIGAFNGAKLILENQYVEARRKQQGKASHQYPEGIITTVTDDKGVVLKSIRGLNVKKKAGQLTRTDWLYDLYLRKGTDEAYKNNLLCMLLIYDRFYNFDNTVR